MSKPKVICLCGSTRFPDAFHLANAHLSMLGYIVISVGLLGHADEPRGAKFLTSDGDESTPEKQGLDQLHFHKIDLADEVCVVNLGGYVGSSTKREIEYARARGKRVWNLFPDPGDRLDPQMKLLAGVRFNVEAAADGIETEIGGDDGEAVRRDLYSFVQDLPTLSEVPIVATTQEGDRG